MRIGVDTGGTFTDFVWPDADGVLRIYKARSTPDDPARAVLDGLRTLGAPDDTAVIHGSTVATNALLEGKGARAALITTRGFADVLEIGRQNRPQLYALRPHKPPPLIPAHRRFEVDERVGARGEVLRPLQTAELAPIIAALRRDQVESVAVCLLFSFLYPAHEQQIADALRTALPDLSLSLSSQILPEYREYERTAATVINAAVAPRMARYLRRLADGVAPRPLSIMQSNGGVIGAGLAGAEAARTVLSGPAGGVVGALYAAQAAGYDDIITFDMGGTSTDVALCRGGPPVTAETTIAGLPLRLPAIAIHTVGAGGGSLAAVDAGRALQVGPQSAGADPGPACYSAGGTRPTVTDANLALGRLDADHFLGGALQLDAAAAERALRELATALDLGDDVTAAAWGVIQVANAHMERAIRAVSVERGHDPRRFTLVPFGGAGPLHACELADGLGIPRVLIPPTPGVLSALGLLVAAPTRDYVQTALRRLPPGAPFPADWLRDRLAPLAQRAAAEMTAEGFDPATCAVAYALDLRYAGQAHELTVPLPADWSAVPAALHDAHTQRYGYALPAETVEIVAVRLTMRAPVAPPPLPRRLLADAAAAHACLGVQPVVFAGGPRPTALYDRTALRPGNRLRGPAVLFQYDTTIVAPPDWEGVVDVYGNLILERGRAADV